MGLLYQPVYVTRTAYDGSQNLQVAFKVNIFDIKRELVGRKSSSVIHGCSHTQQRDYNFKAI